VRIPPPVHIGQIARAYEGGLEFDLSGIREMVVHARHRVGRARRWIEPHYVRSRLRGDLLSANHHRNSEPKKGYFSHACSIDPWAKPIVFEGSLIPVAVRSPIKADANITSTFTISHGF
jgi:hypothetical protein